MPTCPRGFYVVETDSTYYCAPCEPNCDRCIDSDICTHCSVTPTRYYLEDDDCVSSIVTGHYAEFYDDYYTRLEACFYDLIIDDYSCDECLDEGESSCTVCNSNLELYMIESHEGEGVGSCVESCPPYYYEYYGSSDMCV